MSDIPWILRLVIEPLNRLGLDDDSNSGVNNITYLPRITSGANNVCEVRQQAIKDGDPYRRGDLEPGPRQGARSEVLRQRVLRSARCRAGQVRDVAPGFRRQGVGDGSCQRIRRFQADLLSGQGELRHGGDCRVGAVKTGPARPPQDRRRSPGISAREVGPRQTGARPGTGKAGPQRVRYQASSQNDRTRSKKNTPVNDGAAPTSSPPAITAQYEVLRGAALGGVLPLKARSGLMLFLRRGMWGWARTLSEAASTSRKQIYLPPVAQPAHDRQRAVVHVLAAIALSIHDRRTP